MRRVLLLPLLALGLWLAAPASASAAGCAAKDSSTVRSTSKVRVYWQGNHLYGCVRESGVRRHLYGSDFFVGNQYDHVGPLRVAGYHVTFASWSFCTVCGQAGPNAALHEIELRHDVRRTLGKVRRYDPDRTGAIVDGLALDHCGRVAYRSILANSYRDDEDPDPRLFTWVSGHGRHLVDRGRIERRSIRLDHTSVYWVRDGTQREAPVDPPC
jgi:hypothetical protein